MRLVFALTLFCGGGVCAAPVPRAAPAPPVSVVGSWEYPWWDASPEAGGRWTFYEDGTYWCVCGRALYRGKWVQGGDWLFLEDRRVVDDRDIARAVAAGTEPVEPTSFYSVHLVQAPDGALLGTVPGSGRPRFVLTRVPGNPDSRP